MKKFLLVFIFLFPVIISFSQQNKIDSLNYLISNSEIDTIKINCLNELFTIYAEDSTQYALQLSYKALELSEEINFEKGIASASNNIGYVNYLSDSNETALEYYFKAIENFDKIQYFKGLSVTYANIGNIFYAQSNYSKTLEYYNLSLEFTRKINDKKREANLLGNIGIVNYLMSNLTEALSNYFSSLKIREEINDFQGIAYVYGNIGLIYYDSKEFEKSLEYYNKALEIREKINDQKGKAAVLANIGLVYDEQNENQKALEYYEKSLELSTKISYNEGIATAYINISSLYKEQKLFDKAYEFYTKTKVLWEQIGDKRGIMLSLRNIASIFDEQGNYNSALEYFFQSVEIAKDIYAKDLLKDNYLDISEIYKKLNRYTEAYNYFNLYSSYKDSLLLENNLNEINNLEAKYNTEKKEKEIYLLQKNNELNELDISQKKKLLNYLSIIFALILILLIFGFIIYFQKQKNRQLILKKQAEENIRNIEKASEKQLLNKIIEAEENEKNRFAKDLHDGLGPLLSAIKLYINELFSNLEKNEENIKMLKYTNELIDNSITSTRTIANNLKPSIINDYGLIDALKSFIDKINLTKSILIKFDVKIISVRFNSNIEIFLYRVILELINNTLKHAHAKKISIEIKEKNNNLFVNYSDDGIGFEITSFDEKHGMGLNNIKNRINSLNGNCVFYSKPDNGFNAEITVDLNIL
jgi:signal transduction histidine kinase/tetratricopeptide (TPR) repeat protein